MAESGTAQSPSLLSSLEDKLKSNSRSFTRSPCIFKTPGILSRHRKNAFLPSYFSIGPMCCRQKNPEASEKIKIKYLNGLLSRETTRRWPDTMFNLEYRKIRQREILAEWINAVKSKEKEASACYAEHDFAAELGDKFTEIMLLDGCFIIELFLKFAEEVPREYDDPIFSVSIMLQLLHHDLILLENQIPWLVLEKLFEETQPFSETKSLIKLTLHFFATRFSSPSTSVESQLSSHQNIEHILDLLRLSIVLPSKETKTKAKSGWQPIPSVTRLQEAGVKFKKVEAESILDIKFKNGTLEIPSLLIQETMETIFRNLIAYEQCLPHCEPIFTYYAKFLGNLIDSTNDLDILCKKEILVNWMSPEDATQYFNKLYNDTHFEVFYYTSICTKLNDHCKDWWPKWRAAYVHNYFTKPWAVAAQIYAAIMFVLAFLQTYSKG